MNPKQQQIIETFGKGQSVVAGAGCGKTTTLVAKCLALLERNPKARFCAVSFTEKSVRDLREALTKGLGAGKHLDSSHWVKTIHGLCYAILQEFPVSAGLQGGEKILLEDEASRFWERSVQVLWTSTDNEAISEALERLLAIYSRDQLETLFKKLRSLMSFGVEDKVTDEMADLWLVFQSVYTRYQHAKNREGGLDFNDLELMALDALQDGTVANYYRGRFDLVLVDEFQDTNPIQGEILKRFVKADFSNLCIVGDPKQSIYRFRDADVSVFQDLTAALPSKHLLDTNYRSRPGIIEFVNEVCAPAFEASSLPYEALEAGRTEENPEAVRVTRLEIESEADLALFLKSEAVLGVDLSEYVILARSVRGDKTLKFLREMDKLEIPYLLGSGGQFYSDPRVQELVALLRGWISPKNTLSQVAALRSPWMGVKDIQLSQWSATPEVSYFDRYFAENAKPLARALKPLFDDPLRTARFRPGQVLEACLTAEGLDEELYLPLVSLWHKAEGLSSQGQRFEDIVQYFSNAIESEKMEKDIPAPAERGMVRVLTVHSSKGLQFPRVILLDFAGEAKSKASSENIIWDRKRGVHLYRRDEDGARDKADPVNIEWTEVEKSAQIAESKRVFYVALTRAQEELILVWKKEIKRSKASEAPGFNPFLTDNWRAWVEATKIPAEKAFSREAGSMILEKAEAKVYTPIVAKDFDPKPFRPRHSPSEWLILDQCELRYHLKFSPDGLSLLEEDPNLTDEFTDPERTGLTNHHVRTGENFAQSPASSAKKKIASAKKASDVAQTTFNFDRTDFELEPETSSDDQAALDFAASMGISSELTRKTKDKTVDTGPTDAEIIEEARSPVAVKGERIHKFLELGDFEGLRAEFAPGVADEIAEKIEELLAKSSGFDVYREFGFEVPLSAKEAMVGMMDRLEIDEKSRVIRVVDYKFTAKPKSAEELLKNYELQLKLYLFAASKMVDFVPSVLEAELIHFTENSMFERVPLKINFSDLAGIEKTVKTLYEKARLKNGPPRLGDYCRYCEFVSRCPAQAKT